MAGRRVLGLVALPLLASVATVVAAAVALLATGSGRAWLAPGAPRAPAHRTSSRPMAWGVSEARRHPGATAPRRARVDGEFGVLPETPGPIIEIDEEEDPMLQRLVYAVQAADNKRGADISAFWINEGWEIVVIVTALSRPQLQAIANEIHSKMRHDLRLKRMRTGYLKRGGNIRDEAASGWVLLRYPRITVHVMTAVQRAYYDIEAHWRDDNEDYEKIPLEEILREEGFGSVRFSDEPPLMGAEEGEGAAAGDPYAAPLPGEGSVEYEEDEEDPFWS